MNINGNELEISKIDSLIKINDIESAYFKADSIFHSTKLDSFKIVVLEKLQTLLYKKNEFYKFGNYLSILKDNNNLLINPIYLSLVGNFYYKKGDLDLAIETKKSSVKLLAEVYPDQKKAICQELINLAIFYDRIGKFYDGLTNLDKALSYAKNNNLDYLIPQIKLSIGGIQLSLGKYSEAENNLSKAISIGGSPVLMHTMLMKQGLIFLKTSNNSESMIALKAALNVAEQNNINPHSNLKHLGHLLSENRNFDSAIDTLNLALNLRNKKYGPRHYYTAVNLSAIGDVYNKMEDYDQALEYYQKAMVSFSSNFSDSIDVSKNPPIKEIGAHKYFLESAAIKAATLRKVGELENNEEYLKAALSTYLTVDSTITQMRQGFRGASSKQFLAENSVGIYEQAIQTALALHHLQDDEDYSEYLEKAFFFVQKSKALLLLEGLQEAQAKQLSSIPDSLLEKERDMRIDISYFEKQIYDQQRKEEKADSTLLSELQNELFNSKRDYEELLENLEQDFPKYFELKHQLNLADIKSMQQYASQHNTGLIEYFLGDSSLISFSIDENSVAVNQQKLDADFDISISEFRDAILKYPMTGNVDTLNLITDQFNSTARRLYLQLLEKPIAGLNTMEQIDYLTIIPSGILGYLPFELLAYEDGNNIDKSSTLLLQKFPISYAYSSSLLLERRAEEANRNKLIPFGGFAPIYDEHTLAALDSLNEAVQENAAIIAFKNRSGHQDLPRSREEVSTIATMLNGHSWLSESATESNFKQRAQDYGILHLSMHGILDDNNPLYTKLIFSQHETDTLEDGFLNAAELYNLQFNAGLTVLSACNTGYGELKRGEGIMSLARAFAFAGCPSIVMSLWKVPDYATSKLMVFFYEELKKGHNKAQALRNAKLAYLETATPERRHPFFWAGFVPIGDMEAMQNSKPWYLNWLFLSGLLIVCIGGLYFAVKRKKERKNRLDKAA